MEEGRIRIGERVKRVEFEKGGGLSREEREKERGERGCVCVLADPSRRTTLKETSLSLPLSPSLSLSLSLSLVSGCKESSLLVSSEGREGGTRSV
ncbi:hypothetical protein IE53DRAFT_174783 [Violaceomyces palustris]|uniref:Uncharacterized protein n=1 Tax=Violaceomyces palustris TaxID=1673888 RepID=A0ACD0NSR5_9BASI|nr:hypothetical protein IE53DRAFT_174783 [Violaceomyces palustris]